MRYIKPDFFDSETVAAVSFGARLLFQGLWTLADREGRFEMAPRRIKARVFPYDDVTVEPLLDELLGAGLIVAYAAGGKVLGWMPGFLEHQRPHPHEAKSTLPECPQSPLPVTLPWHVAASNAGSPQSSARTETYRTLVGTETETNADARVSIQVGRPSSLIRRRNPSAFWEGPIFDVPQSWAAKAVRASNGAHTDADVAQFARDVTAMLERTGAGVDAPNGNHLAWLDAQWADWRTKRTEAASSQRAIEQTRAYLDEQAKTFARIEAEIAAKGQTHG